MAGYSPVPLPSLSTLFDPVVNNFSGAPASLPSLALVMNPSAAKTLTAAFGEFRLTGVVAALKVAHRSVEAAGAFTLTGIDATLTYVNTVIGVSAPMYLPSMSLVMERGTGDKIMVGASGPFALSGIAVVMNRGTALAADVGSFAFTGAPALRDMQVTSDKATFALTRNDAILTKASAGIVASVGSFALTGIPAGLSYETATGRVLTSSFGQFALTGVAAAFPTTIARKLVCDRTTYAVASSGASLRYTGWGRVTSSNSAWTDVTASSTTWTTT